MIKNTKPLHPGVVLREVYMAEMGLNQSQLAKICGCSHRKINEIINGKRGISPQFAIVLEAVLGTSAEMWARMQAGSVGGAIKGSLNIRSQSNNLISFSICLFLLA